MATVKAAEMRTPKKLRSILVSAAGFAISLGLLTLLWARCIRSEYFPVADELSLLVSSTKFFHPTFSSWFLSGYSQYFVGYPEWFLPYTNFLRPVTNATYYANSLIFGTRWSYYLLFSYCVQGGIVASGIYLALQYEMLSLVEAVTIGGICLISPAFGIQELALPVFGFDLLAALFVLLGIERLLSRRLLASWALFTFAVFTKETALFAPLVAAYVVYRDAASEPKSRRFLKSAGFLLPVLAWSMLRWHAFSRLGGAYVLKSSNRFDQLMTALTGFLSWPTGVVTFFWSPGQKQHLGGPTNYLLALLNLCFWIVAISACVRALQARTPKAAGAPCSRIEDQFGFGSRERRIILLFFAGSLGLPVLLDLPIRFAASVFPLAALTLMCVARSARSKALRIGALAMLVLPAAVNLRQKMAEIPASIHSYQTQWAMSRSYIDHISRSQASTLFLVNDASGAIASPDFIDRFAHYSGKIVRINNLSGPSQVAHGNCDGQPNVDLREVSPGSFTISSDVSASCGSYAFNGAGRLHSSLGQHSFNRDTQVGELRYEMPSLSPAFEVGPEMVFGPGRMFVQIEDAPSDSAFLIADVGSHQYQEVRPNPAR